MSAQLALRDAVVAALLAAPAVAGGYVQANRRRPVPEQTAQAVFVYLEQSTAEPSPLYGNGRVDWTTQLRIECLARRSGGLDADDAADALASSVYARLLGNANLSGLLVDPLEVTAMAWAEDEVDGQLSGVQLLATAAHRTENPSLAAAD